LAVLLILCHTITWLFLQQMILIFTKIYKNIQNHNKIFCDHLSSFDTEYWSSIDNYTRTYSCRMAWWRLIFGFETSCQILNDHKKVYLFLNINQLDALNFIISLFQASIYFEHMCSKYVEAWNKLIIKFSASSWLKLRNKYIKMHGQQNIKNKTVCYVWLWTFICVVILTLSRLFHVWI